MDKIHLDRIFHKSLKKIKIKLKYHENPTVVWLRTDKISSKVHNYINIAKDTIVSDWASRSANTCDCMSSKFRDAKLGHIVTGNLNIIEHPALKSLLSKGANFREPKFINWDHTLKVIESALELYCNAWSLTENKSSRATIRTWFSNVMDLVKLRVDKLKKNYVERNFNFYEKLNSNNIKTALACLHNNFVVTSTDKAMNNFSIICKKFYIETMLDELDILDPNFVNSPSHPARSAKTYTRVSSSLDSIVKKHNSYLSKTFPLLSQMQGLPFLMWTSKMHKNPPSQRFIAISSRCTTKPLSVLITLGLKRVLGQWRIHAKYFKKDYGISPVWIIDNSNDIHERIALINNKLQAKDADTFDFSTLFTGIDHPDLKKVIAIMIQKAFGWCNRHYLTFYANCAKWTKHKSKDHVSMDCDTFNNAIKWLIDNIYVTFGDTIFRQIIGVPMGTNCAPLLANLYLAWYEYSWIKRNVVDNYGLLHYFKSCYRYIDDLLSLNNNNLFDKYKD